MLAHLSLIAMAVGLAAPTSPAPGHGPTDDQKFAIFNQLTHGPTGGACERQAWAERQAAFRGASSDFVHALAVAVNISDPDDRWESVLEAFDDFEEAKEEVHEQFLARLELCAWLGGDTYEPEIDPHDFVDAIDHPLLPFTPGTTLVYEKDTDEGLETVHITATDETREILGVECTVVHDTEWLDGEIQEDTFDYFAQDEDGNVWYFGELSFEYEDGQISGVEGSWIAGEDGAHPGIVMEASPAVGDVYRQEFLLGEAEDAGTVLALDQMVDVPYGSFTGCLQTGDFSPLEPGSLEHKYYAPGIGLVLEVDPDSGERLELVDIVIN